VIYEIDYSDWFDEGGYCQFYPIKNHPNLGFKEFRNKRDATKAYSNQKLLSKFDLAPKLYSKVCKLNFAEEQDIILVDTINDWGYVTEIAKSGGKVSSLQQLQKLVDSIYEKTKLEFWHCHWENIGLITREGRNKLVCIDTGKESFNRDCNAWGFSDPGPKCNYCNTYHTYQCKCSEY